jgi:hypothetical protein
MNRLEESLPPKSESSPLNSLAETLSLGEPSSTSSTATSSAPKPTSTVNASSSNTSSFDMKWILIVILIVVILLLYLGINMFNIFGDSIQSIINITNPFVSKFLAAIGYSTGQAINVTSDVAADTVKTTVDVADGVVQNVGNLLIDASEEADPTASSLQKSMEQNKHRVHNEPSPDIPENTIQKSITSSKQNWCLVGEYQNRRGCISIAESDKCLSGQVFPNQQMCLNPTM